MTTGSGAGIVMFHTEKQWLTGIICLIPLAVPNWRQWRQL